MPPPYRQPHIGVFADIPFQQQPAVGGAPHQWAADLELPDIPDAANLPETPIDRTRLREICRNPDNDVLFGYICTMAWGGQERGPRGGSGARTCWQSREQIQKLLNIIREGNLSRREAYNLFGNDNRIKGLGPSYFTKLLFFFSPNEDFWIMDQWTAKSINLLTGEQVVRISGNSPDSKNKGGNYQAYCEEVDALATLLATDGNEIEQRLMSKGSPQSWPWRDHVVAHCEYNKTRMRARYPHIPRSEL